MNINTIIKNIRKRRGLTQKELADKVGKKQADIAKYETGRSIPPGDVLLRIQALEQQKDES